MRRDAVLPCVGLGAAAVGVVASIYAITQHALVLPSDPLWASLWAAFNVAVVVVNLWLADVLWGQWEWRRGPRGVHIMTAAGWRIPVDVVFEGFDDGCRVWRVDHVLRPGDSLLADKLPGRTVVVWRAAA